MAPVQEHRDRASGKQKPMTTNESAGLETAGTDAESGDDNECDECAGLGDDFPCWNCYDARERGVDEEAA